MKDLIIKINDALFLFGFIIFAVVGALIGGTGSGVGGAILGIIIGALIGAMSSGFWFVLSGIYHNTKLPKRL
jgi:hypothetical protein